VGGGGYGKEGYSAVGGRPGSGIIASIMVGSGQGERSILGAEQQPAMGKLARGHLQGLA